MENHRLLSTWLTLTKYAADYASLLGAFAKRVSPVLQEAKGVPPFATWSKEGPVIFMDSNPAKLIHGLDPSLRASVPSPSQLATGPLNTMIGLHEADELSTLSRLKNNAKLPMAKLNSHFGLGPAVRDFRRAARYQGPAADELSRFVGVMRQGDLNTLRGALGPEVANLVESGKVNRHGLRRLERLWASRSQVA